MFFGNVFYCPVVIKICFERFTNKSSVNNEVQMIGSKSRCLFLPYLFYLCSTLVVQTLFFWFSWVGGSSTYLTKCWTESSCGCSFKYYFSAISNNYFSLKNEDQFKVTYHLNAALRTTLLTPYPGLFLSSTQSQCSNSPFLYWKPHWKEIQRAPRSLIINRK